MKTLKMLLATLLVGTTAAGCFAEETHERWVRPIKENKEYKQVKKGTSDTITYYFRKGEWFETTANNKGDIIYGSEILNTDGVAILDLAKRDMLSNHNVLDLSSRLKIVDDKVMYLNFGDIQKADSVFILRESDGKVVKACCLNVNDSIVFGDNTIDSKAVIRISPANNLSEIVNLADIKSEPVISSVQKEQNDIVAKKENSTFLYILICVLVLIAIAEGIFLYKKLWLGRKSLSAKMNDEGHSGECEKQSPGVAEDVKQKDADPEENVQSLKHNISRLEADNSKLKNSLETAKSSLDAERAERKAKIDAEVSKIRKETDHKLVLAQQKIDAAEKKANTIRDEVAAKFKKEIGGLHTKIQNLNKDLKNTKAKLSETEKKYDIEKEGHARSKRQIESLNKANERFNSKLGDAEFARPYCAIIEKLLEVSAKVQNAANAALSADVEDPYFIFKAIARFSSQIEEVSLPAFYTDVDLVLQTGFTPKGTPLATFDPALPKVELEDRVKNYFFANYLKKYINAVVVLNESMAGLAHLLPDMPVDLVRPFDHYRSELETVFSELGIKVLSVKIFDFVHNNTDLLATQIDAGYDTPGVILDIENCLVSLAGSPKDSERIHVKVQQ